MNTQDQCERHVRLVIEHRLQQATHARNFRLAGVSRSSWFANVSRRGQASIISLINSVRARLRRATEAAPIPVTGIVQVEQSGERGATPGSQR